MNLVGSTFSIILIAYLFVLSPSITSFTSQNPFVNLVLSGATGHSGWSAFAGHSYQQFVADAIPSVALIVDFLNSHSCTSLKQSMDLKIN